VGIGILITASSGEITREKIQDGIAKAADSVKEGLDEAKSGDAAALFGLCAHGWPCTVDNHALLLSRRWLAPILLYMPLGAVSAAFA
jgi:hypothetical protein